MPERLLRSYDSVLKPLRERDKSARLAVINQSILCNTKSGRFRQAQAIPVCRLAARNVP
jgi:hypothetical protein